MPSTQHRWTVDELTGFDGLKLTTDAAVPKFGENDVLVKCKYSGFVNDQYRPTLFLLTTIDSPRRLAQLP